MEYKRRFTFRIINSEDREIVDKFFADHPNLNASRFIRQCIMDGIQKHHEQEVERAIKMVFTGYQNELNVEDFGFKKPE